MKQVFKYGKSDLILSVNFYNDTFILRFLFEKANTFFFLKPTSQVKHLKKQPPKFTWFLIDKLIPPVREVNRYAESEDTFVLTLDAVQYEIQMVDKHIDKLELLYTAGGNVEWCSHFGR